VHATEIELAGGVTPVSGLHWERASRVRQASAFCMRLDCESSHHHPQTWIILRTTIIPCTFRLPCEKVGRCGERSTRRASTDCAAMWDGISRRSKGHAKSGRDEVQLRRAVKVGVEFTRPFSLCVPLGHRFGIRCEVRRRKRAYWGSQSRQFSSQRSLALASEMVCHCILLGTSAPPHASGTM